MAFQPTLATPVTRPLPIEETPCTLGEGLQALEEAGIIRPLSREESEALEQEYRALLSEQSCHFCSEALTEFEAAHGDGSCLACFEKAEQA